MNKYLRLSISFHLKTPHQEAVRTHPCAWGGGGGTYAISPINQARVGDEHDIDDKLTVTIKRQSHY